MTSLPKDLRPKTLEEAWGVIEQLLQIIAEQQAQILALQAQVAELERRLGQNSQNSSRPPSADHPTVVHARRPASKRPPGGQPGHEGHQRMMLPEEQVDAVVAVKPRRCRRCGGPLAGADAAPTRHQVMELPRVRPHVTEYQLQNSRTSYKASHGPYCMDVHRKGSQIYILAEGGEIIEGRIGAEAERCAGVLGTRAPGSRVSSVRS